MVFDKRGRRFTAVQDASLDILAGELTAIVGPSGCGKSTLLHVMAGLLRASSGSVVIGERVVAGPDSSVAYMTQTDTLLPWASVMDNVLLPSRAVGRADRALAAELVERVGLTRFENHYPHELSGGMRKRVQLARALAQRPRVLLMDEPFSALDAQTKILVQQGFLEIWEADRISVVLITHDLAEAISMADQVVLMSRSPGRIKEIHRIELSRPRKADGALTDPEYQVIYRALWSSLAEELVGAPIPGATGTWRDSDGGDYETP